MKEADTNCFSRPLLLQQTNSVNGHQQTPSGRGGGGTSLYKPYRYVLPQGVGFLRPFGLKTGIDFAHFGLESGMVFKGTAVAGTNVFLFQFQMSKKERETWKFEMDF